MKEPTNSNKHTNSLIDETSPYLLQHAHNPVNWYPWNDQTLEKARKENKLLLVSIGYSACHWCHVMEHESFEDDSVASIMNEHFICIKVDREERPDIDQVYMNAVQLMTGSGGWPLNCFALPDGRPIYGGTYFQKQQWINVLRNVADVYTNHPDKALEYAEKLTEGVQKSELVLLNSNPPDFNVGTLHKCVDEWAMRFDNTEGGPNRAPKFPLPNNYQFLLRYSFLSGKGQPDSLSKHIDLTLEKMAFGGIYDQVGGGFSRYSTDNHWKVPHFEKMLYDNAQLVSLYAEAYHHNRNELYKDVVYETLEFIQREMTSTDGMFYSALDADSEGEEGKYYVWTKEELQKILGNDFELFSDYYNVNSLGFWEHGNYILLRKKTDKELAAKYSKSVDELRLVIQRGKQKLLTVREKRVRPGLDDKSLTSWNALMLKAYAEAYIVFEEPGFLIAAERNATNILTKQSRSDGGLNHSYKNGRSTINGYLEDYAFTIEAFISLYQATFDERWLNEAKRLMDYSILHFYYKNSGMFYFTSDLDKALIARKTELGDNVTPASNSSIAHSLYLLYHYYDNKQFLSMSTQMLNNVNEQIASYGSGYSNWAMLLLKQVFPFYEVAIVGNSVDEKHKQLNKHYRPNKIFAGSKTASELPLLRDRFIAGATKIYVCRNNTCQLPVSEAEEALTQMK